MSEGAYRGAKLLLAAALWHAGLVRCPCGGWTAWGFGVIAGTALYAMLARALPQPRARALARPAAWAVMLTAATDEVLWRGWLTGPTITPAELPLAVLGSVAGFALMHLPRQGLRGVAIHTLTGSVFAAVMLSYGLLAAATTHLSYNLWVLIARNSPESTGHDRARHGG